eukprot:TRINITY_DN7543_c0_g1_i2.p1 TRINITY_DN7543_c0_g1~~TRINITY_DN7543_c0_g1_i2.p1  ORF type:complete len:870 (-),score=86.09 TRINITY_DN7543_c0_g1_i2:176-2662(-)
MAVAQGVDEEEMSKRENEVGDELSYDTFTSWGNFQGPRAAALLAKGQFSDLMIVAGEPPQCVPASRILLAAASPSLSHQLGLPSLPVGSEFRIPHMRPGVARALVSFSCGMQEPFEGISASDACVARSALRTGLPEISTELATKVDSKSFRSRSNESAGGWNLVSAASAIAWFGVPLVALSAYWPTTSFNPSVGGLFMDDTMIQKNRVVVDETLDIWRLLRTDYWGLEMFAPNAWTHKSFRPLTVLTFRWNYLLHGFNSSGFHMTNALLHAVASAQLGVFGFHILRLPLSWSALLAALFAAHPVHVENICYIVGRADILCAQTLLMTVQLYSPCGLGHPCCARVRLPAAAMLLVVAGFCKETGFAFFGLLVTWEGLGLTRRSHQAAGSGRWLRICVLLAVGIACCAARFWYTSGTEIPRMDHFSNPIAPCADPHVRKLSYALVQGVYMKLLVWPRFLCYDYSKDAIPLVESVFDVRLLLPCAAFLVFVQVACVTLQCLRTARRKRRFVAEGIALSLGIFTLSFLPLSNVLFPVGTVVGERLLYVPSMGALSALVSMIHYHTTVTASKARHRKGGRRVVAVVAKALSLVIVLACWPLCHRRVMDWSSVANLTLVDGLKQLRSSKTQINLAGLYMMESRYDESFLAYRRAMAVDPEERNSLPLHRGGQILMMRGQNDEAVSYLHKAVSGYFSPLITAEEQIWNDYALALWRVGRSAEAVRNFENAIITKPNFAKGYCNLACALFLIGFHLQPQDVRVLKQGLLAAEKAISLGPTVPLYWRNVAMMLGAVQDHHGAMNAWSHYQRLDPLGAGGTMVPSSLPKQCVWHFEMR